MKPAKFEYHVPSTLDQALEVLGSLAEDGDAKILAGGQSLIPLMNMRLSRPEHLIDLRNILELQRLSVDETSVVAGSMVTQREVEQSAAVAAGNPLLTSAIGNIAHFQIRERGTIGGSIAHADPSAELPLLAVLLDATIDIRGRVQGRTVQAGDFFVSFLTTLLEEDEVVTQVRFSTLAPDEGWGFREFARRRGDFALVAAAATVRLASGNYESARLAFSGVADVPTLLHEVSQLMVGEQPSRALWGEVGRRAALAIEPTSDAHASTEDRRDLMRYLTLQVLEDSTARALHPAPLSGRSRVGSDPLQLP